MITRMRTLLQLAMIGLALFLGACHTIHGAGQDIEASGKTIEKASGVENK